MQSQAIPLINGLLMSPFSDVPWSYWLVFFYHVKNISGMFIFHSHPEPLLDGQVEQTLSS